jgi:hypothetical protein
MATGLHFTIAAVKHKQMPARTEIKILINQTANYTFIMLKRTLVPRLDTYIGYYSPKSQL